MDADGSLDDIRVSYSGGGPVADLGCGPGHYPGFRFETGSMTDLRLADASRLKTPGYGGHPMKVCVHRRQPDQVAAWLDTAGITVGAQLRLGSADPPPGALLFARRRSCPRLTS